MVHTVVVGLGRSGMGAARLLAQSGTAVTVIDSGTGEALNQRSNLLQQQGVEVHLGIPLQASSFDPWLNDLQRVVISPGIAWDHPTLQHLRSHGVAIDGEMAVAWDALQSIPWIGITGTNGKTTVTHLLSHVLEHSGLKAPMGGNMGVSAAEMGLELQGSTTNHPDWLVMELSSYQIEAAERIHPSIGIWTTLTPDHLERHGTLENYRAIKRGLLERSELAILNADDPDLRQQRKSWNGGLWVSANGPSPDDNPVDVWIDAEGWVREAEQALFEAKALKLPGDHNLQNMLLVTAAARRIGLTAAQIQAALQAFPGVPHRLEPLGQLRGIAVFNDSKATNYDAAEVGLRAMQGPTVVLAGGSVKRGDASGWLEQLTQQACGVVLFGDGAAELHRMIQSSSYAGDVNCCSDLAEAVNAAVVLAQQKNASNILLSPACASFDQYNDFEARGDHFRGLIATHPFSSS